MAKLTFMSSIKAYTPVVDTHIPTVMMEVNAEYAKGSMASTDGLVIMDFGKPKLVDWGYAAHAMMSAQQYNTLISGGSLFNHLTMANTQLETMVLDLSAKLAKATKAIQELQAALISAKGEITELL